MRNVSFNYAMVINLYNTAVHHNKTCEQPDCNVSIFQLKQAAIYLSNGITLDEKDEINKLIDEWPL